MALIAERLGNLTSLVQQNRNETRDLFNSLRTEMREGVARIERQAEDHEKRLRGLEDKQTELSARVTMSQILQTTFAMLSSAIAAVIGAVFK